MKNIIRIFFIIIILINLCISVSAADEELVFGVPAKKTAAKMYHAWLPIVNEVEKISGLKIQLKIVKDHQELSRAIAEGTIDFGYFSPIPYVITSKDIGCDALVMRVKYGSPYYKTAFIVKKNSPIMDLHGIIGLNLALTNPEDSTSGYYVPRAMLKMVGIDPEKDLKKIIYSGKHINVLKTVSFGIADVGAIKLYILKDPANKVYAEEVKVIAFSHFLPGSTVAAAESMDAELKAELRKAFLDVSLTETGREALSGMDFNGFVAAEDELYRIIYEYLNTSENGGD